MSRKRTRLMTPERLERHEQGIRLLNAAFGDVVGYQQPQTRKRKRRLLGRRFAKRGAS